MQFRTFEALRIDAHPPLPVHLDGELTGTTPVTFAVQAGALQVLTDPIPA